MLLFGILVGKDGLGLVYFNLLGSGLEVIVFLFVVLILFEGGFNLELRELGRVFGSICNLVIIGILIIFIGGGMVVYWLGEFFWFFVFFYVFLVVVIGLIVVGLLFK